jgi:oligosaccharide repeat unit polymerase
MTSGLALTFLGLLTIANYFAGKRRVLYPPFIFSAVWALDLVIFKVSPIVLDEVHAVTWWVITAGALVFSIGGWLARFVPRAVIATRVAELSRPPASNLGRVILLGIGILALPIMLHDVVQQGSGGTGSTLAAAREQYIESGNEGTAINPVDSKLPLFSICVTIICLIERRDKIFWAAFLLSLVCCFLTTGRSWFLMLLSAVAVVLILKNKKDNLAGLFRYGFVPFLLFVVLFIGLIFVGKDTSDFRGNNWAIVQNFALAYIVIPLPALDYVLTHPWEYAHEANHTFAFFTDIARRLGFEVQLPLAIDSAIPVPLLTNVYTAYKFFFTDFGFLGVFIVFAIIGFFQTVIYRRAVAGGRVSLVLCALLVDPTIMSIFDDLYALNIFLLLKASTLAVVYFCFLSRLQWGISWPRFNLGFWPTRRREV